MVDEERLIARGRRCQFRKLDIGTVWVSIVVAGRAVKVVDDLLLGRDGVQRQTGERQDNITCEVFHLYAIYDQITVLKT